MATLPKLMALKANYNNRYLHYINEDTEVHGFLRFSGDEAISPYGKYEVEVAKRGNRLVHIRCCYNKKYWVRWSQNHRWIVAGADEAEDDPSKWSCTLFEPVCVEGSTLRFRHVQLGHYASLCRINPSYESCIFAGSAAPDNDRCDVFTFIDLESLLILPKHIAFKGDNGEYLSARRIEGHEYLQFASSDIGDPTVGNEVFTCSDGSIRIKSDYFKKFWRRSPNWIWADSDDSTGNDSDTLFWPIKVDDNIIALRNFGNNNFCKSLTTEGKKNCLNAAVCTISREARLEVEELVMSRKIYNVNFHRMDARIYDQRGHTMASENAINRTQEPNTVDLKLSYSKTKSSTWNTSMSLKLGVKTSIQTGIPCVVEGKVEVSGELNGSFLWGETKTSTVAVETLYKVTVPPMSKVTLSLIATPGSFDVPFSYSQRDSLTNGNQITYDMHDGIYTGDNCFNFKYETKEEKL